jgi:hypothetical protein
MRRDAHTEVMESVWAQVLIVVLSVAAMFGAVVVAGLLWAYAPLHPPADTPLRRGRRR